MAIPAGVGRIVITGHMRGGEIWETGWWGQGDLFSSDEGIQQQANSVRDSLETASFGAGMGGLWSQQTGVDKVTVYGYPEGGPHAALIAEANVSGVTGTGNMQNPNQLAIVATLLTGKPGRSYRGRMYWPADGFQPQSGQLTAGECQQVAAITYQLLAPTTGSGPGPVVVSSKRTLFTPVTAVKVDSRFDIQRRRAESQAIAFSHTSTDGS